VTLQLMVCIFIGYLPETVSWSGGWSDQAAETGSKCLLPDSIFDLRAWCQAFLVKGTDCREGLAQLKIKSPAKAGQLLSR